MDIQPIDSKQTMLNESDILIVAAHEADLEPVQDSAEEHGVSPERMMYTIFASLLQNPALILIRSGNTLFSIAAGEDRVGVAMVFNADTEANLVHNFVELLNASHKMGFNAIVINDVSDSIGEHMDKIEEAYPDATFHDDEETSMPVIEFNQPHGD